MQTTSAADLSVLLARDVTEVRRDECEAFDRLAGPLADRIVLFGAGNLGRKVAAGLERAGSRPLAFCDNDPALWGRDVAGLPVLSPADAAARHGSEAAFVIAVWTAGSTERWSARRDQLLRLGCKCVVPLGPLAWRHAEELLPHFALDLPHKVVMDQADVLAAAGLWADERSRAEYLAQVRWRLDGDFDALPERSAELEYFPAGIVALGDQEHFVDCGAYDGDTVRRFLGLATSFSRITAFEPDPGNFARLAAYVAGLPESVRTRIRCVQGAVSDRRARLNFFADGSAGSSLDSLTRQTRDEVAVDAMPLDEALEGDPTVTFLKLDVEGAEAEALRGAERTVREYLPTLAVCVYHRQADLWRLPLQIRELSDRYRFHLRAHSEAGFDVVCYAVPA